MTHLEALEAVRDALALESTSDLLDTLRAAEIGQERDTAMMIGTVITTLENLGPFVAGKLQAMQPVVIASPVIFTD